MKISDVGFWLSGEWIWNFVGSINVWLPESVMCESNFLPNILNGVFPNPKTRDMFVSWCDHNGYFIKLTYSKLNYCIIIDSLLDSC